MILYATRWDNWLSELQWPALVLFASHLVYVRVRRAQRQRPVLANVCPSALAEGDSRSLSGGEGAMDLSRIPKAIPLASQHLETDR